jgi:hypothetical protein
MALRQVLPAHQLNDDSKDVVKWAMGLISMMSALVLALLVASAKSSHDLQNTELTQMSADFVLLDRILARYGSETKQVRDQIPPTVVTMLRQTWQGNTYLSENLAHAIDAGAGSFDEQLRQLGPRNDFQRALYAQAAQISLELGRHRSLLLEQTGGSIPMPFLVVLVFWLAVLFTSFGLYAPTNSTVTCVLFVCAMSVASAVFMILEFDRPFHGLMAISSLPLRNALAHLGK